MGASGLYYFIFDIAEMEIHQSSKIETAENIHTQTVSMSLSEFKAQKDKDEIWVDGALYDVKDYTISGNQVFITVFHDTNEESMLNSLTENIESGSSVLPDHAQHQFSKHKVTIPDLQKIMPGTYSFSTYHNPGKALININEAAIIYLQCCTSILKPPPRSIICSANVA